MKHKIFIPYLLCLVVFFSQNRLMLAQGAMPVGIDSVVITFTNPPVLVEVEKAPLKYNKDFALSFQMDDAMSDIYTIVYPLFEGTGNSDGLYYSNGCGQDISFKMSSGLNIFSALTGADILDPDDPWHAPDKLTWTSINVLYQSGWGILNHGVFDRPLAGNDDERDYEIQRTQSYSRRKVNESFLMKTFIIPEQASSFIPNVYLNSYHNIISANSLPGWLNKDNNGINIQNDTINWLHYKKLNRYFDINIAGLRNTADYLYQNSLTNTNLWIPWGIHGYPGNFTADFQYIYNTYGSPGLDNVLITTEDDIVDYLAVKQETQLVTALQGNKLTLTFGGLIPADRLHYDLSLNVYSDQTITNIQVYGGETNSSNGIGNDTALINIGWDGRYYYPTEFMADSFTTVASNTQTMYDCLVAMDYVLLSEAGSHQDSLRHVLCDIDQSTWTYNYEDGFCNFLTVDLGSDTTICNGNCVPLAGPSGMVSYEWLANNVWYASSSSILACPEQTTRFTLNVTDVDGSQASDSILITVNPVPVVTLGNDTTLCMGDSLVLYGPESPQGEVYIYEWNTGSTDDTIVVSPGIDTQYILEVTNSSLCTVSDSIIIHVANLPVIDTILGDTTSCLGDTIQLEVQGTGIESYLWSTGETTQQIQVSPETGNTTYHYSVQVFNSFSCATSDSISLFVSSLPVIDTILGDTICLPGHTIELSAIGQGIDSYFWNTLDTTQTIQVSPAGDDTNYTYMVIASNIYGCTDTAFHQVMIPPAIVMDLGNDTTICQNNCVPLAGPDNMVIYEWIVADTLYATTQTIVACPDESTEFKLTVENIFGDIAFDSILIMVLPSSVVDLGNDTTICMGSNITLSGPDAPAGDFYQYLWSTGANTQSITVQPIINTQYNLIVTNSSNCSNNDFILINVANLPVIDSIVGNTTGCLGDTIQFEVQGSGIDSYLWSTGDTTQIIEVSPDTGDSTHVFVVQVFNVHHCVAVDSVLLYISELPDINTIIGDTIGCLGDTFQLEVQGSGIESYLWSTGDTTQIIQVIPTAGDSTYTFVVEVTNAYSCSKTDSISIYIAETPVISGISAEPFICYGDTIQLEVQGSGIESYIWNTGDTTQLITVNPQVADTTYTYIVTVNNEFGCQQSDSVTIQVPSEVIVQFQTDALQVCEGNTAFLELNGSAIESYHWIYDQIDTITTTNELTLFDPLISAYVYAEGVNSDGCTAKDSLWIEIMPVPEIIASSDTSMCYGDSVTLSITGGIYYYWAIDDSIISRDSTRRVSPESTTVYYVGAAFSDSICFRHDSIIVNVRALPATTIIYDTNLVCENSKVILLAQGADSYRWLPSETTGSTYAFYISDTTKVFLIGTTTDGCTLTDSLTINTLNVPVVHLSGIYPVYCVTDSPTELIGIPVDGEFFGNGVSGNLYDPQLAGSGIDTVIYALKNNGCFGYDTITTTVYDGNQTIDLGPADTLLPLEEIPLNAGEGFDSYFWSTGSNAQSITVYGGDSPPGTYEYKVIALINGCTSIGSVNITFINPDYIYDTRFGTLRLYPNPNDGHFTLVMPFNTNQQTVRLFSMQGNLVFEQNNLTCEAKECELKIQLPDMISGLYTLQLISGNEVFFKKVMIRK